MKHKIIKFEFLILLAFLSSCKLISFTTSALNKNYDLNFSCSIAPGLSLDVTGEVYNISPSEYNHSPTHHYFYNSLSPKEINGGNIAFFSYIVHCSSDVGTRAFGEEYVQWKMDVETFSFEKNRLSSIFCDSAGKGTVVSSNLFFATSYVAVYNYDSKFSYAIIEEESLTITYVYFYNIGKKENLVFNEKYKPSKKLSESDFSGPIVRESYNMNAS